MVKDIAAKMTEDKSETTAGVVANGSSTALNEGVTSTSVSPNAPTPIIVEKVVQRTLQPETKSGTPFKPVIIVLLGFCVAAIAHYIMVNDSLLNEAPMTDPFRMAPVVGRFW